MKAVLMVLSGVGLLLAGTSAHAEAPPRQAPPAMTEQEIKDYIDQQVDAAVEKALAKRGAAVSSPASTGWSNRSYAPISYTVQSCPAGSACGQGCIDNGDGTFSCPAGTSCGMSQYGGVYGSSFGACASGACASGSCGSAGGCSSASGSTRTRFHLFGRPHRR